MHNNRTLTVGYQHLSFGRIRHRDDRAIANFNVACNETLGRIRHGNDRAGKCGGGGGGEEGDGDEADNVLHGGISPVK